MADFQIIRRSDVPLSKPVMDRTQPPTARLHKTGALHLSVLATDALSDHNCRLLAEFDPEKCILRFTVIDGEIPWGLSEDECFSLHVRKPKHAARPCATISVQALFRHIGYKRNGAQTFEIVDLDPQRHSFSILLPAEQFEPCENSSR